MIEFSRKRVHEGVSAADGRVYTDRCRGKIRSTGVPPVSRDIRSMSRECTSGEKLHKSFCQNGLLARQADKEVLGRFAEQIHE